MRIHKTSIASIVSKNRIPIVLFAAAALLRLYRIGSFATFLSDQGRDAIIIKRIITFEHLPAIGPPTSLGHIFMGPFYYYFIAPFLALGRFDPAWLAAGMALYALAGLFLCYLIVRHEWGTQTAAIFLFLAASSSVLIEYARFSWNPNPLPYFSFIALYCLYKLIKTSRLRYAFGAGALIALGLQLHYLVLFITPVFFFSFAVAVLMRRLKIKRAILSATAALIGFFLFSSPLIIFDLKHEFLNTKNFLALFSNSKTVTSLGLSSSAIRQTAEALFQWFFSIPALPASLVWLLFFSFAAVVIYTILQKQSPLLAYHAFSVLSFILGFSLLVSYRHAHYYMSIYLSVILVASFFLDSLFKKNRIFAGGVIALLLLYSVWNLRSYRAFTHEPNNQIKHARRVAQSLKTDINDKPFNIATWPINFTEDPYLYFLELDGLRPANRELAEITDQMYVLCNEEPCSIIDSPSWNINMFGPAKIAYKWDIEGIIIYKLVHEK